MFQVSLYQNTESIPLLFRQFVSFLLASFSILLDLDKHNAGHLPNNNHSNRHSNASPHQDIGYGNMHVRPCSKATAAASTTTTCKKTPNCRPFTIAPPPNRLHPKRHGFPMTRWPPLAVTVRRRLSRSFSCLTAREFPLVCVVSRRSSTMALPG